MEIREYKTYNEAEILRLYASVGQTTYTDQQYQRKGISMALLVSAWAFTGLCLIQKLFAVLQCSECGAAFAAPVLFKE